MITKKSQKERGITLIALVITIVVLLILAAVTINLTLGERGIFNIAQKAAKNYTDAAEKEASELANFQNEVDNTISGLGNENNIVSIKTDGTFSVAKKVNTPKLNNTGLVPVRIANDGSLTNADITKEEWYSYDGTKNEWANAKTKDGSMWVWIPRYAYKITYNDASDKSKGGTIDVVFLQGTSKLDANGKDVTNENYVDENGKTGAYIIHPAFQDGRSNGFANGEWRKEVEGFWMAKFEAGYVGKPGDESSAVSSNIGYSTIMSWNGIKNEDDSNYYYGTRTVGIKIKYPTFQANRPSMSYIGIADAYDLCMEISKSGNPYGLSSNTNSHLTKNSEWGAVAYLAHSKYGRNGEEITINNVTLGGTNSVWAVTGYGSTSGVSSPSVSITYDNIGKQDGSWTTTSGKSASTTNNLYGIYDLSGGAMEWTAGYIVAGTETDNYAKYRGNLKGESNEYKSKYAGTSEVATVNYEESSNKIRKGEAIWEISSSGAGSNGWNGDLSDFPRATCPFFKRVGNWGTAEGSGCFVYSCDTGYSIDHIAFRAVLVVE